MSSEKVRLSDGSFRTVKRCLSCGIIVGEAGPVAPRRFAFDEAAPSVVGLSVEDSEDVRGLPSLRFADGSRLVISDTDAVWFERGEDRHD